MTCDSHQGVLFLQFDFALITIFLFSVVFLDSQQTSVGVDMRKSLMHIHKNLYFDNNGDSKCPDPQAVQSHLQTQLAVKLKYTKTGEG